GGSTDLDDLCPVLRLIAHCLYHFINTVGYSLLRLQLENTWGESGIVAMSAGDPNCMAGWNHARPFNQAAVNRVHQRDVNEASWITHIADCSESGLQHDPCVFCGSKCRFDWCFMDRR